MSERSRDIAIDNYSKSREFPRSPASISPVPSRRDSLRPLKTDKSSEPTSPTSPPMRLTRKRAASINIEAANLPRTENLSLNSARPLTGPQTGIREQVCLCQPDPKIPRPRNAFILYRQHYQAQVVTQHPGLANPEISKIIGEQWRKQPVEVKNEWKRLAEEEKQRHQRQYPDYRYQPRRAGKANGVRPISSSSTDDPGRCPKCGGRYISTPSTPLTPFTPSYQSHNPPSSHAGRPVVSYGRPHTPGHDQNYQMPSPRTIPPHLPVRQHRGQFAGQSSGPAQPASIRERERDEDMELSSPDFKRRRFNGDQGLQHVPRSYLPQSPYGPPAQDPRRMVVTNTRTPASSGGWIEDRRPGMPMPLPSPGQLIHQHQGSMEPPPRPSPLLQHYPQHPVHVQTPIRHVARSPPFDESLRLPPLQTSMASGPARPEQGRQESQTRSVEAMVMTIPYINKIKVLAKISPPLAPPSRDSPIQHETRGAVVAIEGTDTLAIAEVGRYIQDCLVKEPELAVQTWTSSSQETQTEPMTSPTNSTTSRGSPGPTNANESFIKYFTSILSWHQKSVEIERFITTHPAPPRSSLSENQTETPISPSTTATSLKSPDPSTFPPQPNVTTSSQSEVPTPPLSQKPRIPVALFPHGFSLSTSDHYASRIPINDAYAPVDHWQWTATLWRGIIGPDLTIYVNSPGAGGGGKEGDGPSGGGGGGGVEVRTDCSAIIVRVEDGRVEERCMRRLGFEVLEFVRGFQTIGERI